jgi:hypothetical protein
MKHLRIWCSTATSGVTVRRLPMRPLWGHCILGHGRLHQCAARLSLRGFAQDARGCNFGPESPY